MEQKSEIVLYQPEGSISLEVRLENETVWLTQQQMSELFQTTKQNISLHTGNIFKEKELDRDSVVKESFTTASDGKSYRTKYYNLDVIISVGYRVKSPKRYTVPPVGEQSPKRIHAERLFHKTKARHFRKKN